MKANSKNKLEDVGKPDNLDLRSLSLARDVNYLSVERLILSSVWIIWSNIGINQQNVRLNYLCSGVQYIA